MHVKGLAGGIMISKKGAQVGAYGECWKVAPDPMITVDALRESIGVYEETCGQVLG